MGKDLIIPEKNNIFIKIKKIFSNIFNVNTEKNTNVENIEKEEKIQDNKIENNSFKEGIKSSISEKNAFDSLNKDDFVEELVKNEGALETLSIDRLKKIEKYYEERVNKKMKYLKKLQSNI